MGDVGEYVDGDVGEYLGDVGEYLGDVGEYGTVCDVNVEYVDGDVGQYFGDTGEDDEQLVLIIIGGGTFCLFLGI